MKKLFGTDGIRGVAGRAPLTPAMIRLIGRTAGHVLLRHCAVRPCRMLAVRDTRESGEKILLELREGLRETGVDVFDGGILSTPAAAFLVREHRFQSGVVISASHNPPEFNGIKFFNNGGRKWADGWEAAVERIMEKEGKGLPAPKKGADRGKLVDARGLASDYEDFLIETLKGEADFSGLKVALDCSHGANFDVGPRVLRRLGAKVEVIGAKPTGKNINVGVGSQHTGKLAKLVIQKKCHVGVAFDGDGDRVIFVDERGEEVDGDYTIALLARRYKEKKRLKNGRVVVTVMANLGLKKALTNFGIHAVEVQVGDRYVSAAMKSQGAVLGGEQSGHIILGDYLPTGDGLLTAVHVLAAVKESGGSLSRLTACMRKYPQVLLNVPVKEKVPLEKLGDLQAAIGGVKAELGDDGRVLVRYSGTEPLLRIMLEGPDQDVIGRYANDIAACVKEAIPA